MFTSLGFICSGVFRPVATIWGIAGAGYQAEREAGLVGPGCIVYHFTASTVPHYYVEVEKLVIASSLQSDQRIPQDTIPTVKGHKLPGLPLDADT